MSTRVLLVDDSPTFRLRCRAELEAAGLTLVGEATDGREGVELTRRLSPDVVLIDVEMPGMDGYEATRQIMDRCPTPVVVVSAPGSGRAVRLSIEALRAGALSAMPKPMGPADSDAAGAWARLARMLRAMADVRVVRRRRSRLSMAPARRVRTSPAALVALAASTGGPAALRELLGGLPGDFAVPLLLVQHIGDEFLSGFAEWLDRALPLRVVVAQHGEALSAGSVYIAPPAAHLTARSDRVELVQEPPIGGFRPSANALFASVADQYADRGLGVILTGMGSDGLDGLRALHARGGRIVAQDEETSVVYSMPGSAVRAGLVRDVLPIEAIAAHLMESIT